MEVALRVRAELAFDNTRYGDEFDVDETEPGWAGMLEDGYLTPVDDHVAHEHETRGWKPGDPPVDVPLPPGPMDETPEKFAALTGAPSDHAVEMAKASSRAATPKERSGVYVPGQPESL